MSAEAAQSSETMQRENAFVAEETSGMARRRDDEPIDADLQKFREAALRAALLAQAKAGKFTRAQAEKLEIADSKDFVPATVPYLKTEHVFERIDDERYMHPKHGMVNGFKYGKCINCGLTEEFLRTQCGSDEKPNLYLCGERHKKEQQQKRNFFTPRNNKA